MKNTSPAIPRAEKKTTVLKKHGHERIDPYYWMRERENPEVIDYLNKENEYTESVLGSTKNLQLTLFEEMKGRIKEDDSSAPYYKNGYWYYSRYETGKELEIYCRKKENLNAEEEVLLDENELCKDLPYYEVVAYSITLDNRLMAFTEDITGRRLYQIRFKNLETGEILPYCIENAGSDLAWHNDNVHLYYSLKDTETLRPYLIQSINIETKLKKEIYQEEDDTFIVNLNKSSDYNYLFIGCHSTLTTEFLFKSANNQVDFVSFIPRETGHEYYPESAGGKFFLKTNHSAKNFKIVRCNLEERTPENWEVIQEHNETVFIEDFEVFKTHLVIQEKIAGLSQLNVYCLTDMSHRQLPPTEETYLLYLENNPEADHQSVRIGYSSMTTPHTIYDINLESFEYTLIKQAPVLGDFSPNQYHSERVWAKAEDGTHIPISLVYKKDLFQKNGKQPLLLYAYGSYGSTIDPYFSSVRLSLLDRGFVFAIAHVRGGEYLGTPWYEGGKLLKKKNSFTDFIASAEFLVSEKYAHVDKLFAMGGSAGGLLMGAIANLRPDLWRAIIAQVPFMDVVTTMLDDKIPLTTGEYDEWGNPNEKTYYDYMLSYSPYDQISSQHYPKILITSGLHDSQVQYWEPTKYVAKVRDYNLSSNEILLKTNMDAGHGGMSGRYEQLQEMAFEYAFILWALEH